MKRHHLIRGRADRMWAPAKQDLRQPPGRRLVLAFQVIFVSILILGQQPSFIECQADQFESTSDLNNNNNNINSNSNSNININQAPSGSASNSQLPAYQSSNRLSAPSQQAALPPAPLSSSVLSSSRPGSSQRSQIPSRFAQQHSGSQSQAALATSLAAASSQAQAVQAAPSQAITPQASGLVQPVPVQVDQPARTSSSRGSQSGESAPVPSVTGLTPLRRLSQLQPQAQPQIQAQPEVSEQPASTAALETSVRQTTQTGTQRDQDQEERATTISPLQDQSTPSPHETVYSDQRFANLFARRNPNRKQRVTPMEPVKVKPTLPSFIKTPPDPKQLFADSSQPAFSAAQRNQQSRQQQQQQNQLKKNNPQTGNGTANKKVNGPPNSSNNSGRLNNAFNNNSNNNIGNGTRPQAANNNPKANNGKLAAQIAPSARPLSSRESSDLANIAAIARKRQLAKQQQQL